MHLVWMDVLYCHIENCHSKAACSLTKHRQPEHQKDRGRTVNQTNVHFPCIELNCSSV